MQNIHFLRHARLQSISTPSLGHTRGFPGIIDKLVCAHLRFCFQEPMVSLRERHRVLEKGILRARHVKVSECSDWRTRQFTFSRDCSWRIVAPAREVDMRPFGYSGFSEGTFKLVVPYDLQNVKLPGTLLRSNSRWRRGSTDIQCLNRELLVNKKDSL